MKSNHPKHAFTLGTLNLTHDEDLDLFFLSAFSERFKDPDLVSALSRANPGALIRGLMSSLNISTENFESCKRQVYAGILSNQKLMDGIAERLMAVLEKERKSNMEMDK